MNRCTAIIHTRRRCRNKTSEGEYTCHIHKKYPTVSKSRCDSKVCSENKICNPTSGRCVGRNGRIGQGLKKSPPSPKLNPPSPKLNPPSPKLNPPSPKLNPPSPTDSDMIISPNPSPDRPKPINTIDLNRMRHNILAQLQYDPRLVQVMDSNGFVQARFINMYNLSTYQLGKDIEVIRDDCGYPYIRAMHGWKGPVAMRVMYGKFVPYSGPNNIFCMSHVSVYGLGEFNFTRHVNVLETPDKCVNKGVRAFVNISDARRKGFDFWSKIGDRYGNKIYCFDSNLNENFFKIEYHDKYGNEEVLKITHGATIETYAKLMGGSRERALKQVKKLFITADDSD